MGKKRRIGPPGENKRSKKRIWFMEEDGMNPKMPQK